MPKFSHEHLTSEEKISYILAMQETTTKNVDALSQDVKDMIDTLPQFARTDEKYKSMDKRLTKIESVFTWTQRAIGLVIIAALMGTIIIH